MASEAHDSEDLERPGISTRPVIIAGLGTVVLVVGAIGLLAAIYDWQVPDRTLAAPETFPQPRVQTHQFEQRQRIEGEQRQRLTGYGWVDQSKKLVRIPIERAMRIIAERGKQAYDPIAPNPAALAAPIAGAQRAVAPSSADQPGVSEASGQPGSPSAAKAKP
jgi:hypothetical protein